MTRTRFVLFCVLMPWSVVGGLLLWLFSSFKRRESRLLVPPPSEGVPELKIIHRRIGSLPSGTARDRRKAKRLEQNRKLNRIEEC